jgi:hypothetical protein
VPLFQSIGAAGGGAATTLGGRREISQNDQFDRFILIHLLSQGGVSGAKSLAIPGLRRLQPSHRSRNSDHFDQVVTRS